MGKQIIEDSKLIAEFMEFMSYENNHYQCKIHNSYDTIVSTQYMKFDKDWNWLMPVIKKITDTHFNSDKINCMADYGRHVFLIQNELSSVDIKKTHDEVVKWITWYNQKRK